MAKKIERKKASGEVRKCRLPVTPMRELLADLRRGLDELEDYYAAKEEYFYLATREGKGEMVLHKCDGMQKIEGSVVDASSKLGLALLNLKSARYRQRREMERTRKSWKDDILYGPNWANETAAWMRRIEKSASRE